MPSAYSTIGPQGPRAPCSYGRRAPTNDHDLGLFSVGEGAIDSPAGNGGVGIYHLAWEVDTLDELVGHWRGEGYH